jgi:hypothetical protein
MNPKQNMNANMNTKRNVSVNLNVKRAFCGSSSVSLLWA